MDAKYIINFINYALGEYFLLTVCAIIVGIVIKWYFYMTIIRAGIEQGIQRVVRQLMDMGVINVSDSNIIENKWEYSTDYINRNREE